VRRAVEAIPNVRFERAAVRSLTTADGRVTGVVLDDGRTLDAALVVDTSGRASQAAKWLEALGYDAPPVDEVRVDIMYASRFFTRTPGRVPDRTWYVTIPNPDESTRLGVAFPVEGERWIVTLAGAHGDHPPTDDDGHLAFADSLPTGDIARILREERPVGPIVPHRFPSSQWRRFDRVKRHPAGFVAMGDSICSFNPIYGQGMSAAAQQAEVLAACLARGGTSSPTLWRDFYRRSKKVIANPWSIAAGGDFSFAATTGDKPPGTDLVNRYVAKVIVASQHDEHVAHALWDVTGLLAPPPALMKPSTLLRVLRASRRGPTGLPADARASVGA
jgi:2-polyprenyl-6-methoxyphenol hydroxylase-like FAD-dependent oxidoreductase